MKTTALMIIFPLLAQLAAAQQQQQPVLGNPGIELEDGFLPPAMPEPAVITPPPQQPAAQLPAKSKPAAKPGKPAAKAPSKPAQQQQPSVADKLPAINAAMEEIKKEDEIFAGKLEQIRKASEGAFVQVMERYAAAINAAKNNGSADMVRTIIRRLKLRFEIPAAIAEYKREGSDKAAARKLLEEKLSEEFDLKLDSQEAQARQMEQAAVALKADIKKRKENKQALLKDRADELLGEKMKW